MLGIFRAYTNLWFIIQYTRFFEIVTFWLKIVIFSQLKIFTFPQDISCVKFFTHLFCIYPLYFLLKVHFGVILQPLIFCSFDLAWRLGSSVLGEQNCTCMIFCGAAGLFRNNHFWIVGFDCALWECVLEKLSAWEDPALSKMIIFAFFGSTARFENVFWRGF